MSKYVKELLQAEIQNKFDGVTEFLIVSIKGIGGNENNELRCSLKEKGITLTTVKNGIMRKNLADNGMDSAVGLFKSGPCTVAWGGDSVVDVAKEVSEWSKKFEEFEVKGAYVDGEALDPKQAEALAKMPSRAELQATVVMLANSPASNLVGAIGGPAGTIAACIKTVIENKENE